MQTPEERPKGVELEMRITSASSLGTRTMGMTGPKVSSKTSSDGMRHEVDGDGRQDGALAARIVEHLGALLGGLVDARLESPGGLLVNHGAEVGLGIHRDRRT